VAVALYWVFQQTGLVSISEMLWFSVEKLGYLCTNMLVFCIPGGPDSLCYPLQIVLYNSVLCARHNYEHLCAQRLQQVIITTVCCKCQLMWQYVIPLTSQLSDFKRVHSAVLQFWHGFRQTDRAVLSGAAQEGKHIKTKWWTQYQ